MVTPNVTKLPRRSVGVSGREKKEEKKKKKLVAQSSPGGPELIQFRYIPE